jgi:hypothetical protein
MKKLLLYAISTLFLMSLVGAHTNIRSQRTATANLNVRVFFGPQMGSQAAGACAEIKIVATPQSGTPIEQFASGPKVGAKGGQCTASLKNLPAGVPIELKAVYSDLPSKPDPTHELPAGKWTNPLTLKAGSTVMKYIMIDGKP